MPTPRLLHPILVKLERIDKKFSAEWDNNLREPVGEVRRRRFYRLYAQIGKGNANDPTASEGGVYEESDGYLLFLTADLNEKRLEVRRGDRVVEIGEGKVKRKVDYYITKFQWRGHYPNAAGPTLLKAFFMDRHPSQTRRDDAIY